MTSLAKILSHYSGWISLALIIFTLGLVAFNLFLFAKLRSAESRYREMMEGKSGIDLEALLIGHTRERVGLRDDLLAAVKRVDALERFLVSAKVAQGLVRFNAFEDIHGDQSFALALLDSASNGVVLTAIVGRNESRVYAKGILDGRSERDLTAEEQSAVDKARETGRFDIAR